MFKRRPTIPDYPTSEPYFGPLADTSRREDIESQPLRTVVTVYHSGRSDVPLEKAAVITEEVPPVKDVYYEYPTTAVYEGPLDSTPRTDDIYGEPLTQYVSVYHSGRSDEPVPKPEEEHIDIADAAKAFGEKVTGLFRRGPAHLDYPVSERYEGPLDSTPRTDDIYGEPLTHHVTVYHSGRSDEPVPKPEEEHVDIADAAKAFGEKITGLFKRRPTIPDYPTRGPAHLDYPVSDRYDGPLDSTPRSHDIRGEPLTHHVSVYHIRHDERRISKPEEEPVVIAQEAKPVREKDTGRFRGGTALFDYPTSEKYEGPLDSVQRIDDIYSTPLTHYVSVYHTGRSDRHLREREEANGDLPKSLRLAETAVTSKGDLKHFDYTVTERYGKPSEKGYRISGMNGDAVKPYESASRSRDQISNELLSPETKPLIGDIETRDVKTDIAAQEEVRNKIDLDVFFNVKSREDVRKEPVEEDLVFLSADKLERDQQPVGFSVSISARQPVDRTSSELFSSPSRESSSDTRYLREHSLRSERGRRHRLSPHTWTTVRERTEVTYVRKVRVERSLSPQTPARSHFIKRIPYKPSPETRENVYSCRPSNFDERVMVHHPIYPPNESLYRNGTYNGDMRNGRTYSPVREVAAFDRTEWIDQHPSYIPPNRRADEIFTVGTPFIMGHVEHDGNGCAYLRYQSSGLQERTPLPERIDDLPMIEEGAIECRRATVRAGLRDMDTVGLVQDEEELERRRRPIRRARQRMRSYCTML
ncbi:unnamed protein product [Haemonchus placei]|uniref:Uncharacterized protein n=1 Tax=Haemonchus placei TaxID=6290 RepID=A0A3P8AAN9_HAEPC|nr:unnamed protein product [Haemonchus placei]